MTSPDPGAPPPGGAPSELATDNTEEGGFGHTLARIPWAAHAAVVAAENRASTKDGLVLKAASIADRTADAAPAGEEGRAVWEASNNISTLIEASDWTRRPACSREDSCRDPPQAPWSWETTTGKAGPAPARALTALTADTGIDDS
jgi:hypothetical protein